MTNLRTTLANLANDFAAGVLDAIRTASLAEILAESGSAGRRGARGRRGAEGASALVGSAVRAAGRGRSAGRGGRLSRRSAEDIQDMVERICTLLARHPKGLRAEQIRDALGVQSKELPRPLAEGLSGKRLAKRGEKRATTYFLGGSAPAGAAASGGAKRRGGRGKGRNGAAKAGGKKGRGSRSAAKRGRAGASRRGAGAAGEGAAAAGSAGAPG